MSLPTLVDFLDRCFQVSHGFPTGRLVDILIDATHLDFSVPSDGQCKLRPIVVIQWLCQGVSNVVSPRSTT